MVIRLRGEELCPLDPSADNSLRFLDIFCWAAFVFCIGVIGGFCWKYFQGGGM
jgi:hypothetical protein